MKNRKTQRNRTPSPPSAASPPLQGGEYLLSPSQRGRRERSERGGASCLCLVPRERFLKITEKIGYRRAYSTSYSRSVHLSLMDENHSHAAVALPSRSSDLLRSISHENHELQPVIASDSEFLRTLRRRPIRSVASGDCRARFDRRSHRNGQG